MTAPREGSMDDVTARLLRVFQADRQLAGLQSRLRAAEAFHTEQVRQLTQIRAKAESIGAQTRQLAATAGNLENEIRSLDERIEHLRTQMNEARTNKEYKALLTEVNTHKAERERIEEEALGHMTRVDELKAQLAELAAQEAERDKVRKVAEAERDARAAEIKDRVEQLKTERDTLARAVPGDVMAMYTRLLKLRDDEAMAALEIADRKRHEYTCGACMMSLPMEIAISLLGGKLTLCPNCQCILFITPETAGAITPTSSKR
ncbi:MAG: hypothetical protein AMXMBFR77_09180 [Phycisphaerales bacterium]|nr:hypothetical protein [Phycisphaerales bacterium]MDL1903430.1 hypothetical protein [Synechococcales cyanobacterium CNB]